MSNEVIRVYPDSDLRSGHDGLRKSLRKDGRDPETLDNGQFYLFINRRQSAFKMFAANNTLVHYKSPRGRVDLRTIQFIPQCMSGGKLNFNKALTLMLDKYLKRK